MRDFHKDTLAREKILTHLTNADTPLPATQILQDVLNIRCPNEITAGRVLKGIVGEDARIVCVRGLWMTRPSSANDSAAGVEKTAALSLESGALPGHARGALLLDDENTVCEFEIGAVSPSADLQSLLEVGAKLGNRILLAWSAEEFQLLSRLLRCHRLDPPHNPFLCLQNLAARILGRPAHGLRPENLALVLHVTTPDPAVPAQMARFLNLCFPLLLGRVPAETRTGPEALQAWIEAGKAKVDFTRYGFGPELLDNLPPSPGVYIMRDRANDIIYVGKSRNLRRRVRSYFIPSAFGSAKVAGIHAQLYTLEVVLAQSDVEALLMETRLIREFRPKINLQAEVHERPHTRAKERNLLLLVPRVGEDKAEIYFLREGRFAAQQSVPLGCRPSERIKRKIRSVYFTHRRIRRRNREPWEAELVFRWLAVNRKRINYLDIEEAGSFKAATRRLASYLMDPAKLMEKVCYR